MALLRAYAGGVPDRQARSEEQHVVAQPLGTLSLLVCAFAMEEGEDPGTTLRG